MKKIILASFFLTILWGFAGCGSKESGTDPFPADLTITLAEGNCFSEPLEELSGDVAYQLYHLEDYGVAREDLTAYTALRSSGSTCEEVAELTFSSGEMAELGQQALENYLQTQIDANQNYRPAEIPKLEGAFLLCRGNVLVLVVANDISAAQAILEPYT